MMKLYVKKGECQSPIPALLVMTAFLVFSVGIFVTMLSADNFMEWFYKKGDALVFAIIFFCFDVYFFYALLKKPKKYSAKLTSKVSDTYKGKKITYMIFKVIKQENRRDDLIFDEYKCFTYSENDLIVGKVYNIYIKEFDWRIKKVEEKKDNDIIKVPTSNMKPVFLAILVIIIGNILLGVIGLIYYSEYFKFYIIWIIIWSFIFKRSLRYFRQYEIDNSENSTDNLYKTDLKKYNILLSGKKISKNLIISNLAKYLVVLPLMWFLILFEAIDFSLFSIDSNFIYMFLGILFPMSMILLVMLCYINYDERLIKKFGLKLIPIESLKNIENFKIFRPTANVTFEKYFIVDRKNNNLIFNVQKTGILGNKYFVYSKDNILVAEIISKIFSYSTEYIVRPVNIQPFSVRLKIGLQHDYEITGLDDYEIKGDINGIENVLLKNDEIVASIIAMQNKSNWYTLGNTEVQLNNSENDINIILIALCVTMGNFSFKRKAS